MNTNFKRFHKNKGINPYTNIKESYFSKLLECPIRKCVNMKGKKLKIQYSRIIWNGFKQQRNIIKIRGGWWANYYNIFNEFSMITIKYLFKYV